MDIENPPRNSDLASEMSEYGQNGKFENCPKCSKALQQENSKKCERFVFQNRGNLDGFANGCNSDLASEMSEYGQNGKFKKFASVLSL